MCAKISQQRFSSRQRAEELLAKWLELGCDKDAPAGAQAGPPPARRTSARPGNKPKPKHDHAHEHVHGREANECGKNGLVCDHSHADNFTQAHVHEDGHVHQAKATTTGAAPKLALAPGTKAPVPKSNKVSFVTADGVDLTYTVVIRTDRNDDPLQGSEPWIAICVSSTTRGMAEPTLESLSLFETMLPSLVLTAEEGFRYRVVVVHDVGDAFYEGANRYAKIEAWFGTHVKAPLAEKNVQCELLMISYANSFKKPGPAFNVMLRAAYDFGADFFYRINDDTEFVDPFARAFTTTLAEFGEPFGAVGPLCAEGNTRILTHDFTSRLHLDIFPLYYPHELMDWWMDDWISRVYGARRTLRLSEVHVVHHTHAHGTRYNVDFANGAKLDGAVDAGKATILSYMKSRGLAKELLDAFDSDNFVRPGLGREENLIPHGDRPRFCKELMQKAGIKPMVTWGNANLTEQEVWASNNCDQYV